MWVTCSRDPHRSHCCVAVPVLLTCLSSRYGCVPSPLPTHPLTLHQNVEFLNNPARFLDPYKFRVTFECIAPLKDGEWAAQDSPRAPADPHGAPPDLEWRLIYVASPGNEELDQELDDCLVGPVPVGVNAFDFEGIPPDPSKIPPEDVLGVAALILTGSYKDQEFVRVGYYQNTEYDNEEMKETPPSKIVFERLVRDMNNKPRVTRFQIKWSVVRSDARSN